MPSRAKNKISSLKSKKLKPIFRIRRLNEAHRYIPEAGKLLQLACDIFLAEELKPTQEEGPYPPEDKISSAVTKFKNLNSTTFSYYVTAALLDQSEAATEIAANAFSLFHDLHFKQMKKREQTLGTCGAITLENVKAEAKNLWKRIKIEDKFPFFLTAYLDAICMREINLNFRYFLKDKPKPMIEKPIFPTSILVGSKLKNSSSSSSTNLKDPPGAPQKHVTFNLN